MTTQFNVTLPKTVAKRVRKDSVEMNVPLGEYASVAFEHFLTKPVASRRVAFDDVKPKTVGRKLSLE